MSSPNERLNMQLKVRAWDGNKMYYPMYFEFGVNNWNDLPSISFENKRGMLTTCYFMLYTELKDMHEKDIYEGDILRKEICSTDDPAYGYYGDIGETKFEKGAFIVEWSDKHKEYLGEIIKSSIEIVGNIYESCGYNCLKCKYWDSSIPHDSYSESNCCTKPHVETGGLYNTNNNG